MGLFTTPRERRLWLTAAAVVLTIYSTLGLARDLVVFLRRHNLLRVGVALLLIAVAGALLWWLVRRHPGRRELVVALVSLAVYTVLLLLMERPEERLHLVEYGLLAVLIRAALVERGSHGGSSRVPPWLLAILLTVALGWLDEGIQHLLPTRHYDLRDVGLNAIGGLLAIGSLMALERAHAADRASVSPK